MTTPQTIRRGKEDPAQRSLRRDDVFTNELSRLGRVYRHRAMTVKQVMQAVERHKAVLRGGTGGTVPKRHEKTNVTLIEWDGTLGADRLCVKEFIRPAVTRFFPAALRHRNALRAWKASPELRARGVRGPEALAVVLGKGLSSYLIMRVVDVMYGLPYMLLVIIFMAIFGRNIMNLFLALAIVSWLIVARVVRGQIISLKNSEFVEAARSMGANTGRIVFRHLVPNTLGVIIVFATLRIPQFIMLEAFLSFLGLGISAPYASWGSLVGDAVEGLSAYPWRLFFPSLVMTIFLFSMNFLGDGLRDAFDPQSKNRL